MNIFLDNCSFDFFFKNKIDPTKELLPPQYTLCITPEVHAQVFKQTTPEQIKTCVKQWIDESRVVIHRTFGLCSYDEIKEDTNFAVAGFSDYNTYDTTHGACLTYDKIMSYNSGEQKGVTFFNSTGNVEDKNIADVMLTTHAVNSIVLTCDKSGPLKNARSQGYKIVLLERFENDTLEGYINKKLAAQETILFNNQTLSAPLDVKKAKGKKKVPLT